MKNDLFFESHATSLDNEQAIASGQLDSPLSEKGRKQAIELGRRYENQAISVVYCSDLQRSFETASIAFQTKGIRIIKDRRLREWNYGKFNGFPVAEIERMKGLHINEPFFGGESLLEAVSRVSGLIKELPAGKILIVGHRITYYTLEHLFNNTPFEELLKSKWHWQAGWVYRRVINDCF